MPFQKGRKKTGGREKGVPNKSTANAREIMDKAGFNPLRRMMRLANTTTDEGIKAQMYRELAKYYAPQLKAIEISGDPEKPLYLADADARRRRIEELQSRLAQPANLSVVDAE